MNFAWSLKPIFIWFTILFGTDLDRSEAKSKFRRCLSIIICLFWLLCFSIPFSAYSLYLGVTKNRFPTSFYKQTNWQIDVFGYGTLTTLFHVSILFAAFVKWRPLWEKLQRIQDAIGEDRQFYRQIRRDATMGLMLLLMIVLVAISIISVPERVKFASSFRLPFRVWMECFWITTLRLASCAILVMLLIQVPLMSITTLFREVPFKQTASSDEIVELVPKWKERYHLICNTVSDINDFMGMPLLLFIITTFFTFVNSLFTILHVLFDPGDKTIVLLLDVVYLLIQNMICITCLASFAEKIPKKISMLASQLKELNVSDISTQIQLNFLIVEMTISCPKINVLGLFNIEYSLIPALIGTAITYLLIQYQIVQSGNI